MSLLLTTLTNVCSKHLASNSKLIFWTYSPSNRAFSWLEMVSRPLTCAQPEMPGRTSLAPYLSRSIIKSVSSKITGRGPMKDISPIATFHNCGNSSILVRRKKLPIEVMCWLGFSSSAVGVLLGAVHQFSLDWFRHNLR